jgi:hypothetical protein
MTPLERRCRWLLQAYPAAYRQVRGEEMLATLLEATPDDRAWPLPRDCRSMIAAGLQVRTAQNRRLSTRDNVRLAAMLGCVLYLSFEFYTLAGTPLWSLGGGWSQAQNYPPLAFAAGLVACTAMLTFRPAGRTRAIGGPLAAAALIAGTTAAVISTPDAASVASTVAAILILAALALLSRGAGRLPRPWLWVPGLPVAVALLAPVASYAHLWRYILFLSLPVYIWVLMVFLALAWIVVDARPAIGVAVFLGLAAPVRLVSAWFRSESTFPGTVRDLVLAGAYSFAWELLAVALVLALVSAWRLRRQALL